MNEKQIIIKDLQFFYIFFLIVFVIFATTSVVLTASIFKEVRAFNQCASVNDDKFIACYESHK